MHINVDTQPSCARAWVRAACAIETVGEAYNVMVGVDDPTTFDAIDNEVIALVDAFMREYGQNPIVTVANTIFPQSLYRRHGVSGFYAEYFDAYGRLTKGWGRYFERLTRRVDKERKEYNPLADLIDKLKKQNSKKGPFKCAYDLSLYDPDLDRRRYRNAPCLSFLTFKRHPDRKLSLTALYRNHAYVTRCLGNLIGLGRLQAFVAAQAELTVGPLTCISSHAEIDKGDGKDKEKKWGIKKARQLINDAARIIDRAGPRPPDREASGVSPRPAEGA